MADLLTNLGVVTEGILGTVTDVASQIVATPLLLIPSGCFLLGVSIKFFKKML